MHGVGAKDGDRLIDWGKVSQEYARSRPGPPASFYTRLAEFGIGLKGQDILDLGTGTGVLARQFSRQGANVCAIDISENQIRMAQELAGDMEIGFAVAPAEVIPFGASRFDIVTANQCWLYFDKPKVIQEARRVLRPGGVFSTSHFSWLPLQDPLAKATEELVLKHNPDWSAGGWNGEIPQNPSWMTEDIQVESMFFYDEPIPFTRESWCGRIRACRGVGVGLTPEEVDVFDREHNELLRSIVPDSFTVLHRLDCHIYKFVD